MNVETLRDLYEYNTWANQKTLDSLEPVSAEMLTSAMPGSFASIRDTLVHIIGAEWIWWRRSIGEQAKGLFPVTEFPDLPAFRARWPEIDAGFAALLADLPEDRLAGKITYTNRHGQTWTYSLRDILVNNVNHSSYHRGQVVTLLRQIGMKPAVTDYLLWLDERRLSS